MQYLALLSVIALLPYTLTPVSDTPEEVVARFFERVSSEGFTDVASMMHPDDLRRFREMLAPVIEASLADEDDTFEAFADPADPPRMRQLDDEAFMNLFMSCAENVIPGFATILKDAAIETIGHVEEGDIKHVVVRVKVKSRGIEIERMSVISVKEHDGEFKLLLTGEMKGVAEALQRMR